MNTMHRRRFIGQTGLAAGSVLALSQIPEFLHAASGFGVKKISVGFQSWTIRDLLGKDFGGTLKSMAEMGYKMVEMCSPAGYVNAGFGPLTKMKTSEMRKIIEDVGLTCPSCHFGFGEFREPLDERIEFAKELGLKVMICSTFWLPKSAAMKDYLNAADGLNKAAEKIKAAGMQTAFHNHEFEFAKIDGELIYDALMKQLDPSLVKMQFQTEVINLGYKASDYFHKYPGRFISSHLSDWTADKKEMPIGKGVIDWKEFFTAAKTGGVEYFYVEMDKKTFKDSVEFIRGMK